MNFHMIFVNRNPKDYQKYIDSFANHNLHIHIYDTIPKEFLHYNNPTTAYSNYLRLSVIYEYGGYYVDNDYLMLKDFEDYLKNNEMVFTKMPDGAIINSFFGANKHNQQLKQAIDYILHNANKHNHLTSIGSFLFTKLFEDIANAKYVYENFYAKTNGFLYHDSLSARNSKIKLGMNKFYKELVPNI